MIIVLIKILRIYSSRNQDLCSNGVNFCIQCINRCIKYKVTAGQKKLLYIEHTIPQPVTPVTGGN